ncbi:MAG: phenylalanine--tRNA ligase subunit beta [Vicinamibacterales bacterium]|nr:phenylalanine--tRNA ligase subunit beta [Vicinamibacterales bacterium]
MKIPVSWLREFVDVTDTPEGIGRRLSLHGFAVEGIEPAPGGDAVIDFEVTANRPDAMSVMGIAREVATAYGLPLRQGPDTTPSPQDVDASEAEVHLDAPDLCPRYAAAIADVTVGPSPDWMQQRLLAAGVRPISNIVDITNYVLLELGHPMHAFDLAKLGGGQIRVRLARAGETLRTLDGQDRALKPEMLVIADGARPVAVAGVMGGANSEVSFGTTAVLFESAYFAPLSVRRTSKTLGLKTEASMRFERGADPHMPHAALTRALGLMEQIGAGHRRGGVVDQARVPFGIAPGTLDLRRARIDGLIGAPIPDADIERILTSLGFSLVRIDSGWRVSVPTRRVDITREVDLIEEVARHVGFDNLPSTFPALATAPPPVDPRVSQAWRLRSVMTAAGFSEAVTFGFIERPAAERVADAGDIVAIANPLSETFAVLRPSLVPGLAAAVAHNRRRQRRDVRLFEVGNRFRLREGEGRTLACVWTGAAAPEHWSGTGREVDLFDLKALALRLAALCGVAATVEPCRERWLVPGQSAAVVAGSVRLGVFGPLTPAVADASGLPAADAVYAAELDVDALTALGAASLSAAAQARVVALPRFPSSTRDISILIEDALSAGTVRQTIQAAAPPSLVRVVEFDRYTGKGIPPGQVSLSFHLTFQSLERTLTDAEVDDAMRAVLAALQTQHNAVQR